MSWISGLFLIANQLLLYLAVLYPYGFTNLSTHLNLWSFHIFGNFSLENPPKFPERNHKTCHVKDVLYFKQFQYNAL